MSVDCRHHDGKGCSLALFGGRPSPGVCMNACDRREPRSRGLGDLVAFAIRIATLGLVKPCGACKRRQAALNRALPCGCFRMRKPDE